MLALLLIETSGLERLVSVGLEVNGRTGSWGWSQEFLVLRSCSSRQTDSKGDARA